MHNLLKATHCLILHEREKLKSQEKWECNINFRKGKLVNEREKAHDRLFQSEDVSEASGSDLRREVTS